MINEELFVYTVVKKSIRPKGKEKKGFAKKDVQIYNRMKRNRIINANK